MNGRRAPLPEVVARTRRAAAVIALAIAALGWVGWTTGIEYLTRVDPDWPPITPWTCLLLSVLTAAILLQSGRPGRVRVWIARGAAAAVGVAYLVFLVQNVTGRSWGIDQVWFTETLRPLDMPSPGRPSWQAAVSVLPLATAAGLIRLDRQWVSAVWAACILGSAVIPVVSIVAYLFDATALVYDGPSTGMAMLTAVGALALVVTLSAVRPDRPPLAWLLERHDRAALVRLYGLAIGFPITMALLRLIFLALGCDERSAFALSVLLCTIITMVVGFRLRRGEQDPLIRSEQLAQERAEAEKRYRILADNAVDVIVHLRAGAVEWVSPSVHAALGYREDDWVGLDLRSQIHPDDLAEVVAVVREVAQGNAAAQRLRFRTADGDYRWVDAHAKPYVDADGGTDGVIASLRIVDDRVKVEQQLERLARFDALTGLATRGEAINQLAAALRHPPAVETHLGVLFCDVDRFKSINDTWGHGVGDTVLSTLAARIRHCVRHGDTVGRTGGDEILVVLPGLSGLDQLLEISETIRAQAAEPIAENGETIRATLSIGATLAIPGETVTAVMARADAAMYQAKAGDRNTVVLMEPEESF
ncbi:hypothetical protein MANY_27960 [Mycolicibacterium anyangense]|uniref:Diguanylate cyclase n=1 Tax=Mycolicibacterium anyangense TaxID=1431246 RepID=A0A6N4W8U2_9MYCO|nr:diguanylate cyclase [Mycolicibacterium anyangense]BBZ77459.1 hypothetical protein MANY_27960 [Mycolicibacterium anyangense]